MLEFKGRQNGFSILHNDSLLLEHSPKKPLFSFSVERFGASTKLGRKSLMPREWKKELSEPGTIVVDFPGFLKLRLRRQGIGLQLTFERIEPHLKSVRIRLPQSSGEKIHGLADGYPASGLNQSKTKLLPECTSRSKEGKTACRVLGLKRGQNHHAIFFQSLPPYFAGNKGFFLHIESTIPLGVDLRQKRSITVDLAEIPSSLTFGQADSPLEARSELNGLIGDNSRIPSWASDGIWLSLNGGEGSVAKNLSMVLDAGAKVSAIVLKDWAGMKTCARSHRFAWNWRADTSRYATLEDDIARFRQADIRLLGHVSPYLDEGSEDFSLARKNGWLVMDASSEPHLMNTCCGKAGFVDLWNKEAYEALKSMIGRKILGIGMSGWFADQAVFFPPKKSPTCAKTAVQACLEYSALWRSLNAEALEESGRSAEIACVMRASWMGATWMRASASRQAGGDKRLLRCARARDATWGADGLAGEIAARLNEPGIFYAESGGVSARATHGRPASESERELFMRWTEASVFSPLFCNSDAGNVQPWTDPAVLGHFCRMATIHTLLREYHTATLALFHGEGYPPVAHPSVRYGDRKGKAVSADQYMYGKDLLVMPIISQGKIFAQGTLPADSWIHLWTTREFSGGPVTVEAPLGYPAVFFRADSEWTGLFDKVRLEAKRPE